MTRTFASSSTLALGLCALATLAVGCGSDPVGNQVDVIEATFNNLCNTCPAALGETTSTACLARAEAFLPSATEEACARNVFNAHSEELTPVFECGTRTFREYDTCIRGAIATCPPSASDSMVCQNILTMASCPMPSAATSAELDACTP